MGRRLESAVRSDGIKISYTYNADGLRTSKTIRNVKFNYYWDGDKLTAQTNGENNIWYFRNDGDTPIGFEFNGKEYYYVTNLQGDVIAILDGDGTCVAEYSYDAWSNCTVEKDTNTIAYINLMIYRGYYYDSDTDMYYLQSRYYDARIGRFINADEASLIGANDGMVSNNLFAYCDNNCVCRIDKSGRISRYILGGFLYLGFRFVSDYQLSFLMYGLAASVAHTTEYIYYLNDLCLPIANVMKERFKKSKIVQSRIKKYAKKAKKGTYTKCENIKFYDASCQADRDLLCSIGSVNSFVLRVQYISENKKTKKYRVSIAVIDKYDFAHFGKKEKIQL